MSPTVRKTLAAIVEQTMTGQNENFREIMKKMLEETYMVGYKQAEIDRKIWEQHQSEKDEIVRQ